MSGRELLLDPALARQQPVHRRVKLILGRVGDPKVLRQRGGVPPAGGGQLGLGRNNPCGDQGADQVAFAARFGGDQRRKAQALHGPGNRLHRPMAA